MTLDPSEASPSAPTRFTVATAPTPGAIAIGPLRGPAAGRIVARLIDAEPPRGTRLARFEDIDEGLVARLRDDWWQLMPHGGPRVLTRLTERLRNLGAEPEPDPPAAELYPEADTPLEADMLHVLARAASPAAIDPLLAQPSRWAAAIESGDLDPEAIRNHSDRLDRLVTPPGVVLLGRANVGKSTLANAVVGRTASITADLPGTTRDWVAGLAELRTPFGELAVRWFDTPGLRRSDDPIEQRAVELARDLTATADLLIAVADPATPWPDTAGLPRRPELYLLNKADLLSPSAAGNSPASAATDASRESAGTESRGAPAPGDAPDHPLPLSALHGEGLDRLADAVTRRLGLADLDHTRPWAFNPQLRELLEAGDREQLRRYTLG
jgi:tRNA modification GTPase